MTATDVVVVGAGLAGCAVASQLSSTHRVLVIDAGPPGGEASSHNAGMVRRLGEDPWERALAIRSAERLAELGPEVSTVTGAVLGLVHDATHLHDAVAHARARGVRVDAIAAEDVPALAGAAVAKAWFVPDERVADSSALLASFLRPLSGRVRGGVTANALTVGPQGCTVHTSHGDLACGAVVLAGGAWSAALGASAGVRRPLVPVRRTLVQSAPHARSVAGHPWVWLDDVGVYARPEAGGWLASPCDEAVDVPVGPGSRGPVEMEARALLVDKLERYLPALADARWTGGWTGLRTFAPDRRPVLGADPDAPGLWWAAGLGGFGVTCAIAVGEAVAAWMRGETTPWIDPAGVSPGRAYPRRWAIRPDGSLSRTRLISAHSASDAR